jgi:FtsH-binding integral membrane protein
LIAMSDYNSNSPWGVTAPPTAADMAVDQGLRRFMLGVYNKMALGLALSGGLAYAVSHVPALTALFFQTTAGGQITGYTLLGMAVRWAPIVILLVAMFAMRKPTTRGASLLYWAVVACFGLSLGVIFFIYNSVSIASTFLVTAAAFGALSLWGYTTKRDLTAFGAFLIMGLVGLILASLVSWFIHSAMLSFVISIIGVLIFAGLTAYDTQKTKMMYYAAGGDQAVLGPATSYAALNLYLDFLNLFLFLLRLFGGRR